MKMHAIPFISALSRHTPHDSVESQHLQTTRKFVESHQTCFWQRTTLSGHVTGSAFVVNEQHSHALLLHHAKLNRWVQPGGHLDDDDASPAAGALREASEETGILALTPGAESLFDIDVHAIPARNKDGLNEPAHYHYDARYLVVALDDRVNISDESLGFRWVALETLALNAEEPGMVRMAKKALQRKGMDGTR